MTLLSIIKIREIGNNFKNNKSPGIVEVTPEYIHNLIKEIRIQERMQNEWNEDILYSIPKKKVKIIVAWHF